MNHPTDSTVAPVLRKQKSSDASPDRPRVLLIVETSMAFGRGVLEGISRYLVANPPWSVHLDTRDLIITEPEWLRRWDGDGIITRSATPTMEQTLKELRIPTVNLTDIYGGHMLPSVINNHKRIGEVAAEHLIERGFRHFGYCGFSDHHWSALRLEGFQSAIRSRSLSFSSIENAWAESRMRGWESQQPDILNWLNSLPRPVGIMACNDLRGQHVLEACRAANISVPEEVAVIGVDDDQVLCNFSCPPLTSVIPAAERIGFEAAAMLGKLMRGERIEDQHLEFDPLGVETRQSTDILAITDSETVKALRVIRERACLGLTVTELLREVPIARSVMERRFRSYLGRSPQAEIRNVQLKRACQLLRDTELPLAQIASLTGFKHSEYFSVVFKRCLGITPGNYRDTDS
jgi:LacI family transcriptional regulator